MSFDNLASQLPEVQGWITSRTNSYVPTDLSVEAQRTVAALLIKRDPALVELIKSNCKGSWAIALKIGKYTAHMRLFDLADANSSAVPYTGCDGMLFKIIDKRLNMHDASESELSQVLQCRPILYADRRLTSVECEEIAEITSLYPPIPPVRVRQPQPAYAG